MKALQAYVRAVGVVGPGMNGWQQAQTILADGASYQPEPIAKYAPERLPRNERRRATPLCRLAFQAAEEAVADYPAPEQLTAIFASSGGDVGIVDQICQTLASSPHSVSPTQFHNSVHNAAAGYWSIATGARQSSNSFSAHDSTLVVGLREALLQLLDTPEQDLLLCVYDIKPPVPLLAKRPLHDSFAFALLLSSRPEHCQAQLLLQPSAEGAVSELPLPELEALRQGNPAGRGLPLLQALAQGGDQLVVLDGDDQPDLALQVIAAA